MIDTITALAGQAAVATDRACALVGVARSTYYRLSRGYRHYQPVTAPILHIDRVQPAALTQAERDQIIEVLTTPTTRGLGWVRICRSSRSTGGLSMLA